MKLGPVTKIDERNPATSKKGRYSSGLWPIWSNLEAGFWMHGL